MNEADGKGVHPRVGKARPSLCATNKERSTARGVAQFLILSLGYGAAFLGTVTVPGWGPKLIGAVAVFFFLFRLFLIGHEAGHGNLTPSALLNRWIGRLTFLPCYIPLSAWVAGHNALHHPFTNLRGKDPLWVPLSKEEYDSLSPAGRALERFYRTLLGVGLYNMALGLKVILFPGRKVRCHIPPGAGLTLERWAVFGFLFTQLGGLLVWEHFLERTCCIQPEPVAAVVAAVLLPLLIFQWWNGLLGFLQHTHLRVRWYADPEEWRRARANVQCSVHLVAPWPVSWLLGNPFEHTAHHVGPKVPSSELPAFQDQLEAAFPEVIQKVKLTDCLRILAFCKLYDYQEHRWLDYTGQPMSENIAGANTASLGK